MKPGIRLSYANVVSTLALVAALAGGTTAVAVKTKVSKNSVTAKSIKRGAVTAKTIRDGAVGKNEIANGAVGANQLGTLSRHTQGAAGTVTCASGERLVSGGAFAGGGLIGSNPSFIGQGWDGVGNGAVTTYAICLAP